MSEKKDTAAANAVAKANTDFKGYMMSKVDGVAASSGTQLSPRDKTFANDIILNTYKKMMEEGINPNEMRIDAFVYAGADEHPRQQDMLRVREDSAQSN